MDRDSIPPWIAQKILRGEAIIFLGAGASIGAEGPGSVRPLRGNELRDALSDRFLGGSMRDRPLSHVAEIAKSESSLVDVQGYIYELFEPLQPAKFHEIIAEFRWHAIITTNFDFVIERAYQRARDPSQSLGRIIRDGDKFGDVISSIKQVPFLKLHGCLSVINDPALPLILATEEYAKHRTNRIRLFGHFQDWSREYPIIFCGYDLADPNVQQILYDIGDSSISRSPFLLVRPKTSALDKRYWQSRRVNPVDATLEEFLQYLVSSIPKEKRVLSRASAPEYSSIQKRLIHGQPSAELMTYLSGEIDHLRADIPTPGVQPTDFYRGLDHDWDAFRQQLDIRRRMSDDLTIEAILDAPESTTIQFFLVKGHAGSGKSTTLRRVAWDAATEHDAFSLWMKDGGLIRPDLLGELCSITQDRVFFFVEDALQHLDALNTLATALYNQALRLTVIMGARTNEWNVAGEQFHGELRGEYELRDLSDREIGELLERLERHDSMGSLANLDRESRLQHFVLSADRQLLVALHEATSGKPFEEIVLDEYRNLVPREAQLLYADVCTLHRFGVGVRSGLLSRISGVTFDQFERKLLKPLEHVVTVYLDRASRDYAYRTRHSLVADWVFRQVFEDQDDQANQIVRIVAAMNTDFASDKQAFEELIRGRGLAELFSDRVLADRIFEAAILSGAAKAHIQHQRAVFELHHPSGNVDRALKSLESALENSEFSRPSVMHTKALALRRKALASNNRLAKEKYRNDAKEILRRQIRKGNRPHPYHTLGQILLEELVDAEALNEPSDTSAGLSERHLATQLADLEKVVKDGLQKFPGEPYLLALEAQLAESLRDNPRAFKALTHAHKQNPNDEHIAIHLAKIEIANRRQGSAKGILASCTETNPRAKLARLELALILIAEGEDKNREEVRRLLRSAFVDGDRNYESQFWYARHEFLYGDAAKSKQIFEQLGKVRVPPYIKNQRRGPVLSEDGNNKEFRGTVVNTYDSYCIVEVPELSGDIFVHHSEFAAPEWAKLHVGSRIELEIAFSFKGIQGFNVHLTNSE